MKSRPEPRGSVIGGRRPSWTLLGSPDPAPICLAAAFALAACAGCTNAAAMLGVFEAPGIRSTGVTHVTGSFTKIGMVLADGPASTAPCLAVLAYVAGAAASGSYVPPGLFARDDTPYYADVLLATAVILACAAAFQEVDHGHGFGFAPLFCAALASGAQNGMATAVSSSIIRTTHMTGCATDIGLILGKALGRKLQLGPAPPPPSEAFFTTPELKRLGLYARLAAGFIGGAAAGTALVQQLELKYARTLYVPAAILLALGAAGRLKLFAGPPQNAGLTNAKDIVPNSARQELVPPHNP